MDAAPGDGELTELSLEECERLLEKSPIGRVGFTFAGKQVILPVNYRYLDREIIFRSMQGQKMHAAAVEGRVAFEVDEWDGTTHSGWSVLVKGRAERMIEREALEVADEIGPRPWADEASDGGWIRVRPEEITGRWLA